MFKLLGVLVILGLAHLAGFNSGYNRGLEAGQKLLGMRYCEKGIECIK